MQNRQAAEIKKLKRELDVVRESVRLYERKTLAKDESIEQLTKALEKLSEKNSLQQTMMNWKLKRMENAHDTFATKLADAYYERRVKARVLLAWQRASVQRHKQKLERVCKKKAEEVCYDLAKNYEAKIKKLDDELHASRAQIAHYRAEMAKHEEHVKQALMRGVCALNMEAMAIFSGSSVEGGESSEAKAKRGVDTSANTTLTKLSHPATAPPPPPPPPPPPSHQPQALVATEQQQQQHRYHTHRRERELSADAAADRLLLMSKESALSDKQLARKIKSYCEQSMSLATAQAQTSQHAHFSASPPPPATATTPTSASAAAANSCHHFHHHHHHRQHSQCGMSPPTPPPPPPPPQPTSSSQHSIQSCGQPPIAVKRVFTELIQHREALNLAVNEFFFICCLLSNGSYQKNFSNNVNVANSVHQEVCPKQFFCFFSYLS